MKTFLYSAFMISTILSINLDAQSHPFVHDLAIKKISNAHSADEVTLCCHGYGHCNEIVDVMHSYHVLPGHLVGFNFPDYGIAGDDDHTDCKYGTIDEILPLLYMIKQQACDLNISKVNLYGFSAGGGAIINALAILNQGAYAEQLKVIGISQTDTKQMLSALEQGHIILDCPLKSMDEIIDFRGSTPELELVASSYRKNNMNPIDVLPQLAGLTLNILLHFQNPDEVLGNRDDKLFIDRLRTANSGATKVVIGSEGGHAIYHTSLWKFYTAHFSQK